MQIMKKTLVLMLFLGLAFLILACDQETTINTQTTTSQTTTATLDDSTTFNNVSTTNTATQTENTTTTGKYQGIQVVDITKTEYNLGETFDTSTITVLLLKTNGTSLPLDTSLYQISGFDSSAPGEKTVTVSYDTFTTTITVTVLPSSTGLDITMSYYESAEGLMGIVLLEELNEIINAGFVLHSYASASFKLDETDEDPDHPGNVILVYSGYSVSGTWDSGATWNKEHVWPQSLLDYDPDMTADIHNLKPANPGFNTDRGNKYYANESTIASFEPRNEVKGDVARILFYMMVMYYPVLELVDTTPMVYQMGLLNVLLAWHEQDPVDDFERNRNEIIYDYQKNRNPFIDYPEFVALIWDNLD